MNGTDRQTDETELNATGTLTGGNKARAVKKTSKHKRTRQVTYFNESE